MGKLVLIAESFLAENSRKAFPHEGIEVSIALSCLKIISPKQRKGNDDFKEALLVVNLVVEAVEGGYPFEEHSG
jgi:hypothetical protein